MTYYRDYMNHKPDPGMWRCPLCGASISTAGAAGHLRIKHNIKWKSEYLRTPWKVLNDDTTLIDGMPNELLSSYFSGIDYRYNSDVRICVQRISKITSILREKTLLADSITVSELADILSNTWIEVVRLIDDRNDKIENLERKLLERKKLRDV